MVVDQNIFGTVYGSFHTDLNAICVEESLEAGEVAPEDEGVEAGDGGSRHQLVLAHRIVLKIRHRWRAKKIKPTVSQNLKQCCGSGSGSAWIRNFCLDPAPELKFRIRN